MNSNFIHIIFDLAGYYSEGQKCHLAHYCFTLSIICYTKTTAAQKDDILPQKLAAKFQTTQIKEDDIVNI